MFILVIFSAKCLQAYSICEAFILVFTNSTSLQHQKEVIFFLDLQVVKVNALCRVFLCAFDRVVIFAFCCIVLCLF